jgi:hypothetical protein
MGTPRPQWVGVTGEIVCLFKLRIIDLGQFETSEEISRTVVATGN